MKSSQYTFKHELVFCLLIVLALAAIYGQVIDHEFVSWDDPDYVTDNSNVQNGLTLEGLNWAFNFDNQEKSYWHPLTWLSHMTDVALFGNQPGLHHLMNLAWHMLSTCLLFYVLHRVTQEFWPSVMVATLFAVHPMNVESVAWVSERKNLLSTFFWMLSIAAYVFYARSPNFLRYMLVVVVFVAGLLSKPMLVTLPFVFLLIDYWPLERISPDMLKSSQKQSFICFLEKLPLLSIAILITYLVSFADKNHMVSFSTRPLSLRLENVFVSYFSYIGKLVWPFNLAIFYPFPKSIPFIKVAVCVFLLGIITYAILGIFRKYRFLSVGWFWFLGTLIPVSGLIQSRLWPAFADRHSYVPFIGLFIIYAWGVNEVFRRSKYNQTFLFCGTVPVMLYFGVISWHQVQYWRNSETLYSYALEVSPRNYVALNNLSQILESRGQVDEAVKKLYQALEINPEFVEARYNLINVLKSLGRTEEARHVSEEGMKHLPNSFAESVNLSTDSLPQKHLGEEISDLEKYLLLHPEDIDAHFRKAQQMEESGLLEEAAEEYILIIDSAPYHFAALNNLAMLSERFGKKESAILYYQRALMIAPENAELHYNYASALAGAGREDAAEKHFALSLEISPSFVDGHINFGIFLAQQGRVDEAISYFSQALQVDPNSVNGHSNMGILLYRLGNKENAAFHFQEALKLDPGSQYLENLLQKASQGR